LKTNTQLLAIELKIKVAASQNWKTLILGYGAIEPAISPLGYD
jgi:hypothetical protein